MLKIIISCLASLAFGVLLALQPLSWPIRPGVLGATLLVVGALWVRKYWNRRKLEVGDEPSAAERNIWLWMVGTALLCGYVISILIQPGSEFHTQTGDTGGFDSWLILAGMVVAAITLRSRDVRRDERDIAISNLGIKVGYTALIVLLIIMLLSLGFAPQPIMQRFTHWLLANTLLSMIMLACLAQYLAQLICYWMDMRNLSNQL